MGQAKILAVDDEPDFEALLKQRFRRRIRSGDYAFRFARHGEEALTVLAEDPGIELLLLDINMPVMDGLTLLSVLQQRQIAVRAIIVSAYGDMDNIRTAMNRGAFDFVTKPVDLSDLEITVRKTLDDIARVRELDRRRAVAERARHNLSRYFSPNLVGLLADRDEPLGPVRRETVAVVFADIVGFTRMAESMEPEDVVTLLREFHERMAEEIFACGGTIEKYIGDAIFCRVRAAKQSARRRRQGTEVRPPHVGSARRLEPRTRAARPAPVGDRHRHQLRASCRRRRRQQARTVLHRDW